MRSRLRLRIFAVYRFKNGLATCSEKKSMRGPMKKAVMIVPIPTIEVIPVKDPVVRKKSAVPRATQMKSQMILT